MNWLQVLCVGDSQTSGARAPCGWPDLLTAQDGSLVLFGIQAGVPSDTSPEILIRLPGLLERWPKADVVTLMTGTNDARDLIPADVTRGCLRAMVLMCIMADRRPLVIVPPNIRGGGHDPVSYPIEVQTHMTALRKTIRAVAHDIEVYVAVLEPTVTDEHFADDVHFNVEGQREMARLVAERITLL